MDTRQPPVAAPVSVFAQTLPVALFGPPGAGKSTVGRDVAEILGRRFVDLDEVVAARAGCSIRELIAEQGLETFRALEAEAFAQVLDEEVAPVVALGAGATEDPGTRRRLKDVCFGVLVQVRPEEALQRLASSTDRPLLAAADPAPSPHLARARYLSLEEGRGVRRPSLARLQVQTDARSAREVADEIAEAVAFSRFRLPPPLPSLPSGVEVVASYAALQQRLSEVGSRDHIVVVDEGVADAMPWLTDRGECLVLDVTGPAKRLDGAEAILDEAVMLPRGGLVIAIGGGALLDVAGLAAALSRRGTGWWAVPTTLLAMVDAGLGGKTAVDHPRGRNLIGAFWPPERLIVWPGFLSTLPTRQRRAGAAEMVKHALLMPPAAEFSLPDLTPIIEGDPEAPSTQAAIMEQVDLHLRFKAAVVEQDPRERSLRRALNFGHTYGHALEHAAQTPILHGEAVALGLQFALRVSAVHAGLDPQVVQIAWDALTPLCPPFPPVDQAALSAALQMDKKATTERGLEWVLLRQPGVVQIGPLPDEGSG